MSQNVHYEVTESSVIMQPTNINFIQECVSKTDEENNNFIENNDTKQVKSHKKMYFSVFTITCIVLIILSLLLLKHLTISKLPNKSAIFESEELKYKREFVRNMTREAWNAYYEYAWGEEALSPVSNVAKITHLRKPGWTIVSSMSTLHVMNLEDEFAQGKQWIDLNLNFSQFEEIEVKIALEDYLGGLLSCYALTGDEIFKENAIQVANNLEPVFNSNTGLLYSHLNPKTKSGTGKRNSLSWIGHQQPELLLIAHLTGSSQLKKRLWKIKQFMSNIEKPKGLYMHIIDVDSGQWHHHISTLGSRAIKFYYDLLRSYILSGGRDADALTMFSETMSSIVENEMFKISKSGLVYATEYNLKSNRHSKTMTNSACRLGAMLLLGASKMVKTNKPGLGTIYLKHLALNLTETCYLAANKTATKLLPIEMFISESEKAAHSSILGSFNGFYELAETYFFLWRLTHEPKYRNYAWQLAQTIHQHCRTNSGGYSGVKDVNAVPTEKDDIQSPYFLSATFKYLYLTFTDDTVLSLDKWIFNAFGQALPICGQHQVYPENECEL